MARFQEEKILYTREWTQEVDTAFIEMLKLEAINGRFHTGVENSGVLRAAMEYVNNKLGTSHSYSKCCEQFRKLRRRYRVYSDILKQQGVWFDEPNNTIRYDIATWQAISKMDPLVVAYQTKGEPEIEALRTIFQEEDDSVDFFYLQSITHISSNIQGYSDIQKVQFPRYGFDNQLSNSFWSNVAMPSSQGEYNTSHSVHLGSVNVAPENF